MLRKTSPSTSRIAGGANFWPTWPHSTRKALLRRSAGFAKKLAVTTSNQNRKITQSSCLSAFDGCSARPSRQGPACGKPVEYGCAQGLFCSGCFTKHVERAKKCLITHTNKVSELVAARKTKSEHVVSTRKAVKRENEPIAGAKEESRGKGQNGISLIDGQTGKRKHHSLWSLFLPSKAVFLFASPRSMLPCFLWVLSPKMRSSNAPSCENSSEAKASKLTTSGFSNC